MWSNAARRARGLWMAPLLALAGCGAPEGFLLRLVLAPDVAIDRVVVNGAVDGDDVFAPALFPDEPRALTTGDTITLLLDERLSGGDLTVTLRGQQGDLVQARGAGRGVIVKDAIGDLDVELASTSPAVPGDDDGAPVEPDPPATPEPPIADEPADEPAADEPAADEPAAEPDASADDEERREEEKRAREEEKRRREEERRAEQQRRDEEDDDEEEDDDDDD